MSRRIAVVAIPPNASWRGPLLAFLDNRARQLRDDSAVRRARVLAHDVDGRRAWALVIDFAHEYGASELVRDVVADLEALNASPLVAPRAASA